MPLRLFRVVLGLVYLAGPVLIILELFRPVLSIPIAVLAAAYIAQLAFFSRGEPPIARADNPVSNIVLVLIAFVVCAAWVAYSGIGSFAACRWDYVKHNLMFSYLLDQQLPIYTSLEGREVIVHYSFAYYITPVRIFEAVQHLTSGVSLNAVLLAFYSIVLFLAMSVLSRGRAAFLLALLAVLCLTGGLDVIGMLAFGVKPVGELATSWATFALPVNFEWWGLPFAPQSFSSNLYYAPQHFFGALIGTALLQESLQSERPNATPLIDSAIIIAAGAFWSPYVAVGLGVLAVVLTFSFGIRRMFQQWKGEKLPLLRTPAGLIACAFAIVLCCAALLFLWGSKPLSPPVLVISSRNAWRWLLTYALNYAPYLIALVLVLWPSFRRSPAKPPPDLPKILAGGLVASALVLLVGHGFYNDWAMRATLPLSIALAVALTRVLFEGFLKWPYLPALLTVLALSSASSLAEIVRGVLEPKTHCAPYGSFSLKDMGELENQYEGRSNSVLYRYLAR
jgi:hypothetical protein